MKREVSGKGKAESARSSGRGKSRGRGSEQKSILRNWNGKRERKKSQGCSVEAVVPSFRDKTWVLEQRRHG